MSDIDDAARKKRMWEYLQDKRAMVGAKVIQLMESTQREVNGDEKDESMATLTACFLFIVEGRELFKGRTTEEALSSMLVMEEAIAALMVMENQVDNIRELLDFQLDN